VVCPREEGGIWKFPTATLPQRRVIRPTSPKEFCRYSSLDQNSGFRVMVAVAVAGGPGEGRVAGAVLVLLTSSISVLREWSPPRDRNKGRAVAG
jgi:uncharacterized membrane protein (DUF4010 family)